MQESIKHHNIKVIRRARRVRARIQGNAEQPRLSVHLSNQHLYAQCIDDARGKALLSVSDKLLGAEKTRHITIEMSKELGKRFAELLKVKGIVEVAFDRGSRLYHGRIKSFADGVREGGIKF